MSSHTAASCSSIVNLCLRGGGGGGGGGGVHVLREALVEALVNAAARRVW